ncbi:hypothetical protein [Hymenobacter sp. B1770]|uniref:hypothetical protein n=1 Tax=Hymenobacter sp. B1770 TaxID=1718788 RepID=UPI003CEA20A4
MSKNKQNDSSEHKKDPGSPMGPDALNPPTASNNPPASVEAGVLGSDSTITQNANQNHITVSGNQIKGNQPGGNVNDIIHSQVNKPRSNPQGNSPMSVDKSQKGPGRKAN